MVEGQDIREMAEGTEERPPMTAEQFEASLEFRKLKSAMRKILRVPKTELDGRVRHARETSPRISNPHSPGRKRQRD